MILNSHKIVKIVCGDTDNSHQEIECSFNKECIRFTFDEDYNFILDLYLEDFELLNIWEGDFELFFEDGTSLKMNK
jgi:hypothetical protein